MAIDYNLIGRFNQVQPGGLTRAIRGGVDLRGQVLQNEAQQFNLQQAPILAERATQKWNQDLANLQAEEQLNIQKAAEKQQEIKQKELEAQQKRYTDSMSILGRSLYSVNDDSQIPIVIGSLKQMADNNVIDPNVFYNIPGIKEGRLPTVQEAKVISNSLIETKDQLLRETEARKAEAEKARAEQSAIREQGIQNRFDQAQQNMMNRLDKQLAAQERRFQMAEKDKSEKEKAQMQKVDFNQAMQIRKEYSKPLEAFEEVKKNYNQLKGLGDLKNNPKAKMAVVYSFMKMLDPGSTVRETEYASVAQASDLQNKVSILASKVDNGQPITDKDVSQVMQAVESIYNYAKTKHQQTQENFKSFMENNGIDSKKVSLKFYDLQSENKKNITPTVRKTKSGLTYEVIP